MVEIPKEAAEALEKLKSDLAWRSEWQDARTKVEDAAHGSKNYAIKINRRWTF
jgi:hypothetical protein